jgi:hypothetical protein
MDLLSKFLNFKALPWNSLYFVRLMIMREVRKDHLATTAILLMLLLLTSTLLTNLNKLESPSSSDFGRAIGILKSPSSAHGELLVTVESNLTLIPSSSPSNPIRIGNEGFLNQPLQGVYVSVSNAQNGSGSISNTTSKLGQTIFYLPPAKYEVEFVDQRLNYTKFTLQVYNGEETKVTAYLNATGYSSTAFSIVDSYDTGSVLPWEDLYIRVPSGGATFTGSNTFIETEGTSLVPIVDDGNFTTLTPVSIVGTVYSQNSEWLDTRVGSPVSIQSIQMMQLLSMNSTYKVTS